MCYVTPDQTFWQCFGSVTCETCFVLHSYPKEYLEDQKYRDEDDLPDKLESLKSKLVYVVMCCVVVVCLPTPPSQLFFSSVFVCS